MTSHFRRGKSKVYYNSEVWDPGAGGNGLHSKSSESEEDLARTSFRSIRGDVSEHEASMRDDQSRYDKYTRILIITPLYSIIIIASLRLTNL